MLEILQFYVSDLWVWLGITIGISAIGNACALALRSLRGRE